MGGWVGGWIGTLCKWVGSLISETWQIGSVLICKVAKWEKATRHLTILPRRVPYFSTRALLTFFGLQSMVKRLYWFFNVKKSSLCSDCFTDYSQNNMSSLWSYGSFTNSLGSYLNCTLQFIQAFPPTAIKWLVHYTFYEL